MRRTKIVATLGPATDGPGRLTALLGAGVDVARFNLSHGTADDHTRRLGALRQAASQLARHVPALWDTKGPEVRLGEVGGKVSLVPGASFTLTSHSVTGNASAASVSLPDLPSLVDVGERILLDDGSIVLSVEAVERGEVRCRVIDGGVLGSRKKVTAPGLTSALPAVSGADLDDFALGARLGVEIVAASFVRTAAHILELREAMEALHWKPMLLAKIETAEAVANIQAIVDVADGILVARGDLGLALPTEEMPIVQKRLISVARRSGKPVVTATQMLESMVDHPRPTRAEATDVANAILDGSDAVMLSEETAVGRHPIEAVNTMARIADVADEALVSRGTPPEGQGGSVTEAISTAIWRIARDVEARAIISATQSGHTARMVARHRPRATVVATTPDPWTARKLAVVWGVHAVVVDPAPTTDEVVDHAIFGAMQEGLAEEGDVVLVTAGVPVGVPGTTNLIQVRTLGEPLVTGQGIGGKSVRGHAHIAMSDADALLAQDGDILVVRETTPGMVPAIERVAGVIAEEGGLTSHAALIGVSLQKPVIVGAGRALDIIRGGDTIVLDARRGRVWRASSETKTPSP